MRLFVDQHDRIFFAETVKELAEQLGHKRGTARRMYVDKKNGDTVHVGYVIGRFWLTEYKRVERCA